ncbi:MAG TPA: efflux RND transporter permease subunit [Euzebyales bacterium]
MIRAIVGWSMKFRGLVIAVAAGVMILGVALLSSTAVDTLPEFTRPTVEVQAEALGLSAEEVEQLITVPLEQDLLNGVAFLEEIESASLPGLSSVVMTFEEGTDILDARQVVAERLTQAVGVAGLPEVSKPPAMLQPLSSSSRVAMVRLTSEQQSPIEMSVLARWVIAPRLLGVEGVANVAIWGFRDRQLQVLVDPQDLRAADVSLNQVVRTTGNALEVSPLSFLEASSPGTGGWIDTVNQRLHIFHEQAITTPEELGQVPLEGPGGGAFRVDGQSVTLDEVADVAEDHQPLIGDAYCSAPNDDCLLLVVEKFPAANTPEVARGVDEALEVMQPGLGGITVDTSTYRPAEYISSAFAGLGRAAVIGAVLFLAVLIGFFAYWRTAVIAAVTVPLALVAAALVLNLRGATVNLMVIAGLTLGLVVIIDDAVADVSGVAQSLRRRRQNGSGAPAWRTILDATLQLRTPLLYATVIALAAVVPMLFTDGLAGAFIPSMLTSYVLAVVTSLVVALTVAPALSLLLLRNAPLERHESPLTRWLGSGYDRVSGRAVGSLGPALAALAVIVVAGLVAIPLLDLSLRPSLRERDVLVEVETDPGTSLQTMDGVMAEAVSAVGSLPGVRDVGAHVGRAITSDQIVNVNSGEIWVTVDGSADYEGTLAAIDEAMSGFDEIAHDVTTYSAQRVTEVLGRRDADSLVVRVYGEDPAVLAGAAEQVRTGMAGIDGVVEPTIEAPPVEPTIEVEVDLAAAEANDIKPGDVRRAAAILLSGITAGNLFEEQKVFDVVVWGAPDIRENEEDIANLLIDNPAGGQVRLGDVADVRVVDNPAVIRHHSVMSYVDVVADVDGRDLADVASDADAAIEGVVFPLEYHAEVLGGYAEQSTTRTTVLTVAGAAAIVIFLLLQAAFGSWRLAVLAFLLLPTALSGGLVAALLTDGAITLGTVGGLIAVLAITARALIVLVRHAQHLQRAEEYAFGPDVVVRATRDRLGTIVMAGLATIAVFLPFAALGGAVGFEIIGPMAVAVIGGLITSTVVVLLVAPALYLRFGHVREPDTTGEDLAYRVTEDLEQVM